MDDNFGEWVELYGHGYNVYVWLVGVVVRRYIDILIIIINFPYIYTPLVIGLFSP